MQDDGRFIPPGPGRIIAFSREGGFGKSRLLSFGLGMLGFTAALYFLSGRFYTKLILLTSDGLSRVAPQTPFQEALRPPLLSALDAVWPVLVATLAGVLAGTLVPAFIARSGKAFTVVALPKVPRARVAVSVLRCFGTLVFAAACALIIRETQLPPLTEPEPAAWFHVLGNTGLQALFALGLIAVLVGVGESLVLRHAAYSALFLNRAEHRLERRAADGAKDLSARGRRRLQEERAR